MTLKQIIVEAILRELEFAYDDDGTPHHPHVPLIADDVLNALCDACTVHTAEELDALPADSVVLSEVAIVAYQRARTPGSDWYSTGLSTCESTDIPLPARVIWNPDWSKE